MLASVVKIPVGSTVGIVDYYDVNGANGMTSLATATERRLSIKLLFIIVDGLTIFNGFYYSSFDVEMETLMMSLRVPESVATRELLPLSICEINRLFEKGTRLSGDEFRMEYPIFFIRRSINDSK